MAGGIIEKLTGAQITVIALAAILTPGALAAAVTFSNVAVVNPTTGTAVNVDSVGRVPVVDSFALLRNNPANLVTIRVGNFTNNGCEAVEYTVPTGKALILTALSGYTFFGSNPNGAWAGVTIFPKPGCTGTSLTATVNSASAAQPMTALAVNYGAGIPVPAGSVISVFSSNNVGLTVLHGYLVPANYVSAGQLPAAATAGIAAPGLKVP